MVPQTRAVDAFRKEVAAAHLRVPSALMSLTPAPCCRSPSAQTVRATHEDPMPVHNGPVSPRKF